ncbi:MAG: hypothetical protein IKW70_04605 [Verrucomicrobia bacterium]|nr:hypothetical protein [Verrucomicrobiota bacterium]MBO4715017.1 hypothetical protein [Verrucomicrobiota bacterium]MBR5605694.1 hypothetical protein [Verrucomicrobiota bacterium]MBR5691472.1 hypothetical protein [Verrucomicrobiota bacterium]MBR5736996.1 hypothetical protein [Verrucomicrobiota bacterium]
MSNMTSVEVIELLYQLQEIELGEDAASPKNQKASAELRAKLPPNILGHYDRLMKRGKKGVSIVSGTNCPECHMTLPTGTRAQLMRGEDIVLCDTCARYLLYRPIAQQAVKAAAKAKPAAKKTTTAKTTKTTKTTSKTSKKKAEKSEE